MKELKGNLFDPSTYLSMTPPTRGWVSANITPDAICITTNGFVKKNGEAVMGRGCARTAAQLMPGLPEILGLALSSHGVQVYAHGPYQGMEVVSFPVKPILDTCWPDKSNVVKHMQTKFKPGDNVPGWACVAELEIIMNSALQLVEMADERNWNRVVLPRMGCGAGELDWCKDVRPLVESILDDRFYVITF